MSSVSSISGVSTTMTAPAGPARKDVHELFKAVRTGDLQGAQQAYVAIVKAAPAGTPWPKDSAFAELGKSLVNGDLDSAKQVIVEAIKAYRGGVTTPAPMPEPETMALPVDGTGTMLNVAA